MIRALKILTLLAALGFLTTDLFAAERSQKFSLAFKGTYTSSAKLFPTPNAAQEVARTNSLEFNDALGFGFELRRQLGGENIEVGVAVEYLNTSKTGFAIVPGGPSRVQLPVTDGFRFVPVEVSGYFIIPLNSQTVKFFMGGGVGFYYGDRNYRVANVPAETLESQMAFGIHVLTGLDYFITPGFSIRGELKFRDPQFDVSSRFNDANVEYGGRTYRLSLQPFPSKVNLDGLVVNVGVALNF